MAVGISLAKSTRLLDQQYTTPNLLWSHRQRLCILSSAVYFSATGRSHLFFPAVQMLFCLFTTDYQVSRVFPDFLPVHSYSPSLPSPPR